MTHAHGSPLRTDWAAMITLTTAVMVPGEAAVLPGRRVHRVLHATEDRTSRAPTPVAGLRPPKVSDKLVPVFAEDKLAAILATCKGGGLQNWPAEPRRW